MPVSFRSVSIGGHGYLRPLDNVPSPRENSIDCKTAFKSARADRLGRGRGRKGLRHVAAPGGCQVVIDLFVVFVDRRRELPLPDAEDAQQGVSHNQIGMLRKPAPEVEIASKPHPPAYAASRLPQARAPEHLAAADTYVVK